MKLNKLNSLVVVMSALLLGGKACADEGVNHYEPVKGLSGILEIYGHAAVSNEMSILADGFQKIYPEVEVRIEPILIGRGLFSDGLRTVKNPIFMIDGVLSENDINKLKDTSLESKLEITTFAKTGYILVNKSNPVSQISMNAVGSVFFSQKGSGINEWKKIGYPEDKSGASEKLRMHGMNETSMYTALIKDALGTKEPLNEAVNRHKSFASLVSGISGEPFAIGYAGDIDDSVKALSIQISETEPAIAPPVTSVDRESKSPYPFLRFTKIYSREGHANAIHVEFFKYVLSDSAMEVIKEFPFVVPLTDGNYDLERQRVLKVATK